MSPRARPIPATFLHHGPGRPANRHQHSDDVDYEYEPFNEGDTSVPEPCWDQHPALSETGRFFDRITRWGDQELIPLDGSVLGPILVRKNSKQLVMYETRKPYSVRVTMNATDPTIVAPVATYFVIWTVLIGCGSTQRTYRFLQQVQRADLQPLGSDVVLPVSAEVVRVMGQVEFTAAFAPQTARPTLQAMCAPEVYLPDSELGPRSNDRNVIR
jgi:hypothetical protein